MWATAGSEQSHIKWDLSLLSREATYTSPLLRYYANWRNTEMRNEKIPFLIKSIIFYKKLNRINFSSLSNYKDYKNEIGGKNKLGPTPFGTLLSINST